MEQAVLNLEKEVGYITPQKGYILVKQKMVKKKRMIHLPGSAPDKEKFNFSFEIVKVNPENERAKDQKVGDHPIFTEWVKFQGLKVIEKDDNGMVSLVIVHENDVIATDSAPLPSEEEPDASAN